MKADSDIGFVIFWGKHIARKVIKNNVGIVRKYFHQGSVAL